MIHAIEASQIEVGDKFVRRNGHDTYDIAVVIYRSADNSIGYRLKGSSRIYNCAPITFLKKWKRLEN